MRVRGAPVSTKRSGPGWIWCLRFRPGGGKAQVAVGRAIGSTDSLQQCVLERASTWSFPSPAAGATPFRTGIIFAPDDHGACPPGPNAAVRRATASKERLRTALAARQDEVKACYQRRWAAPRLPAASSSR